MLSFVLFLKEIIQKRDLHFREEFKGHRPDDTRKCNDKEVSHAASYELVAEEENERLRESRLDGENDRETQPGLNYLCVPGSARLELRKALIDKGYGKKAEGAGEER